MKTEAYKLYKIETVNGRYGETTNEIFIDDINILVNEQHLKSYVNEIQYLVKVVIGITKFKSFSTGEKYIVCNNMNRYEVQSFIICRWTQLQLKEVIV